MEHVLGFGGFFFTANAPATLAAWYQEHLGIPPVPEDYGGQAWIQDAGPTVFAPMVSPRDHSDDEFFYRPGQTFALNFRVRDLDAMVQQLQAADIEVRVDSHRYPNGRFASLKDPEGNPIQLWEPAS